MEGGGTRKLKTLGFRDWNFSHHFFLLLFETLATTISSSCLTIATTFSAVLLYLVFVTCLFTGCFSLLLIPLALCKWVVVLLRIGDGFHTWFDLLIFWSLLLIPLQLGGGVIEDWFSYLDLIFFVIEDWWWIWFDLPSFLNQSLYPPINKDSCFFLLLRIGDWFDLPDLLNEGSS